MSSALLPRIVNVPNSEMPNPEHLAMLQALYSRSFESVTDHLAVVANRGADKFMAQYYVGYGHKSIGDCGTSTMFYEGVSMLAAKAIQDTPLYNGQECSTRYIDFSNSEFHDPIQIGISHQIMQRWRTIYTLTYTAVRDEELAKHPNREPADKTLWNAIHAKACDIARGFLPLGAKTQLSWQTTLRQFADRMNQLDQHPLAELRYLSRRTRQELLLAHGSSFKEFDYPERQDYYAKVALQMHYILPKEFDYIEPKQPDADDFFTSNEFLNARILDGLDLAQFGNRPAQTELPRCLGEAGNVLYEFFLDFGTFRDIQRHRNGFCRIPLVAGDLHIHPWYLEKLPVGVKDDVLKLLDEQVTDLKVLINVASADHALPELQYFYPMAQMVPVRLAYTIPQSVYVAELRSTKHVHPTLRKQALKMGQYIERLLPTLNIHLDYTDTDAFNLARGTQTISKVD